MEKLFFIFCNVTGRRKMVQIFNWQWSCKSSSQKRNWAKAQTPHHVADIQVEVQYTYVWLCMLMAIADILKADYVFLAT